MHSSPRLLSILLLFASLPAFAATYTVTRGDDPEPNGCTAGDCSLREALEAAVATPGSDTVLLGAGQYTVTRGVLSIVGDVTIGGLGADDTRIVGNGDFVLLHVTPLGNLVLEGARLSSQDLAVDVDSGAATLRGVQVPPGGGVVSAGSDNGPANLRIEHSELGDLLGCECGAGSIHVTDSTLNVVLAFNGSGDVVIDRSDIVGPSVPYGIAFTNTGTLTIRDSTISGHANPLVLDGSGGDVRMNRTRFIGNTGPMLSNRDGMVWMDELEFSDNLVDDAHADLPAVLLAQDGTSWRISRALFSGNRGGGGAGPNLIGATVRVLAGGNVAMGDVTFINNTFRVGVVNGVGDAIGVDVADTTSTVLTLFHATMRSGPSVPGGAIASLLAVRGAAAVRVFNSIMQGTCAFASGGVMLQAAGNIESPGHTCQFALPDNDIDVSSNALLLGPLADNGGFTPTYLPASDSPALDRGAPTWCGVANAVFAPLDQRRYLRPIDGIGCDSGAVEAGALSDSIFADGLE